MRRSGRCARSSRSIPMALRPGSRWQSCFLESDRFAEALPLLTSLAETGCAEAAFYLGVYSVRCGALAAALGWMERALALNPDHNETREQVDNLRRAISGNV